MIQANELRIGNYLEYLQPHDEEWQLERVDAYQNTLSDIDGSELWRAIPLSEEWLFKFGFEKTPFGYYKLGSFYIDLHSNTYRLNREGVNIKFQYIHSFQNLYFALTNQELTIKEL
jgi:hypothetical protein